MKKKNYFVVLTICFCVLFAVNTFAGDVPESIITDENTDVILGTITNIGDTKTTIEISKALFETIDEKEIELDNFNYFAGEEKNKNPKVGDYCAVAVVNEGGALSLYNYLCARADSLEPETLKLATDEGYDFAVRMNGYINDGMYSKAHREEVLGAGINTPDETNADEDADTDAAQDTAPSIEASIIPPEPVQPTITNIPLLMIYAGLAVLIALAAGVYTLYIKITKKNKPKRDIKKGKRH